MLKIRPIFIVLGMLLCPVVAPAAQVSIGISVPHVSIGFNLPAYPRLVVVPGYPVYYAPQLEANFFFYDGMYWVYQDDYWYASSWYNGPWWLVDPADVPLFVLRIPVRYYRQPPAYFLGWQSDAPPRWGDHWGHDWEQHRSGWDRWNRGATPAPAPLPAYQRQYSGDRYPRQVEQQHEIQNKNYRYQPRDPVVRQHSQEQAVQRSPAQQEKQGAPEVRGTKQQDNQRSAPHQQDIPGQQAAPAAPRSQSLQKGSADVQKSPSASPQQGHPQVQDQRQSSQPQAAPAAPRSQSPQRGGVDVQRSTPGTPPQGRPEIQAPKQQAQPGAAQREQQMPRSQGREEKPQGRDATREPKPGQGQEQERGRGRNE